MDKNKEIDLEKDLDILFDDNFEFKPITKGLGFHHSIKEKKEVTTSLKHQQAQLKDDLHQRNKALNKTINRPNISDMGELAPFYQEQKNQEVTLNITQNAQSINTSLEDEDQSIAVSMFTRFGAWIVDMIIVTIIFSVSFISMMILTEIPLEIVRKLIMTADLFVTIIPIFAIFYIFYFSFFDKTTFSTPGKKLAGLKVVNAKNKNISMIQALMRSLITLISFLTFALLVILDAQSKITDTKVVKR